MGSVAVGSISAVVCDHENDPLYACNSGIMDAAKSARREGAPKYTFKHTHPRNLSYARR